MKCLLRRQDRKPSARLWRMLKLRESPVRIRARLTGEAGEPAEYSVSSNIRPASNGISFRKGAEMREPVRVGPES